MNEFTVPWIAVIALFALVFGVGVWLGLFFGLMNGERKGRDAEWCRQYFERLEKEKARRRANGQFKSKSEITTK